MGSPNAAPKKERGVASVVMGPPFINAGTKEHTKTRAAYSPTPDKKGNKGFSNPCNALRNKIKIMSKIKEGTAA